MGRMMWIACCLLLTLLHLLTAVTSSATLYTTANRKLDPETASLLDTIFGLQDDSATTDASATSENTVSLDCHLDEELPPIPDLEPLFLEGMMLLGAVDPVTSEPLEGSQLKGFYSSAEDCMTACKKFFGCFAADYNIVTGACILHGSGTCSDSLTADIDYVHFRKVPCAEDIEAAFVLESITPPGIIHVAPNYRVPHGLKVKAANISECIWACANAGAGFQEGGVEYGQICFGVDFNPHKNKCFLQLYSEWENIIVTPICYDVPEFLTDEGIHDNGFVHYTFCPAD